ncbi:hypothetical protein DID77_00910 [Candidatus Marinamargulisbacteria bacterium SCGC AG-439-L15]|nr:hypothetical protein DID77_00910 [Candidatus Marinamargulisbacteria bacterium SCGC AG-439-L15]
MSKQGFFGLFGSKSEHTEEEKRQRDFAESQKNQEKEIEALEKQSTPKADPKPSTKPSTKKAHATVEITEEIMSFAKERLESLLTLTQFGGNVSTSINKQNQLLLEVTDAEDTGRLIGREGNTIDSLQILIRAMIFQKFNKPIRLMIDTGHYLIQRLENAKTSALQASNQLNENNTRVELAPMSPAERQAIHQLFQDKDEIDCHSEGENRQRHIILELKEYAKAQS